jgi:hypothetical protein
MEAIQLQALSPQSRQPQAALKLIHLLSQGTRPCEAGFKTMVQPAASAGPALRVIIAAAKFQGLTAAVTPIGCFSTIKRLSGWWPGITSS